MGQASAGGWGQAALRETGAWSPLGEGTQAWKDCAVARPTCPGMLFPPALLPAEGELAEPSGELGLWDEPRRRVTELRTHQKAKKKKKKEGNPCLQIKEITCLKRSIKGFSY